MPQASILPQSHTPFHTPVLCHFSLSSLFFRERERRKKVETIFHVFLTIIFIVNVKTWEFTFSWFRYVFHFDFNADYCLLFPFRFHIRFSCWHKRWVSFQRRAMVINEQCRRKQYHRFSCLRRFQGNPVVRRRKRKDLSSSGGEAEEVEKDEEEEEE